MWRKHVWKRAKEGLAKQMATSTPGGYHIYHDSGTRPATHQVYHTNAHNLTGAKAVEGGRGLAR